MKIVHINCSNYLGGAAVAAGRLNEAMQINGYDSIFLASDYKPSPFYKAVPINRKKSLGFLFRVHSIIDVVLLKWRKPIGYWSLASSGFDVAKSEYIRNADIIFIHWVSRGCLSLSGIENILKLGKPVFFFMHDMWLITGGCHHSFSCNGYMDSCSNCPLLKYSIGNISKRILSKKKRLFNKYDNWQIITPSVWLSLCAQKSALGHTHKISVCKNLINTSLFKPLSKEYSRNLFNFPQDKKLILFGADNIKGPYKGWEYLVKALNSLGCNNIECVIFGALSDETVLNDIPYPIHYVGYAQQYLLITLYNAVDLLLVPSLADNFPNIIVESLACGTPVVAFDVGGIPDLIQHKKNGYLAKYRDINDLVCGITYVLDLKNNSFLGINARLFAESYLSYNSIVDYEKILDSIIYAKKK